MCPVSSCRCFDCGGSGSLVTTGCFGFGCPEPCTGDTRVIIATGCLQRVGVVCMESLNLQHFFQSTDWQ